MCLYSMQHFYSTTQIKCIGAEYVQICASRNCFVFPTKVATVQFVSGPVTVEEGELAMVCVELVGLAGTTAVGCDVSVTLTTATGKAGMCLISV